MNYELQGYSVEHGKWYGLGVFKTEAEAQAYKQRVNPAWTLRVIRIRWEG